MRPALRLALLVVLLVLLLSHGGDSYGQAAAHGQPAPPMRLRIWCDQTVAVPLEEVTFGVRYVCQVRRYDLQVTPSRWWWRTFTQIYRDGTRLIPREDALNEHGRGEGMTLTLGESREYTFTLADAIELDQVKPGRYVIFVHMGPAPAVSHAVEFEVFRAEAGGDARLFARATAQGVRPSHVWAERPTAPSTQPTTMRAN